MNRIIKPKEAIKVSKEFKKQGKKIVLVGGCFDIVHIGHIKFLENSKKKGDILFVLLESNEKVKKLKGEGRPINSQIERAYVLQSIKYIDYVILLPNMKNDDDYDKLISQLKPGVIATIKNDSMIEHKKRQAKLVGAKIRYAMSRIKNKSTTQLVKLIK
ncbi:MAG: adenylyltransferase/cytidyltransferase family protein [Candidatus Levybacteria bacterium]|nr:adenylyltransferase/cytidyltransferase family protein [Candidatus Levybacteria bacterium]